MAHGPKVAVELQPSEMALLHAASRIYAAHIAASGEPGAQDQEALVERSIEIAVAMALRIDRHVQSDDEVSSLRRRGFA